MKTLLRGVMALSFAFILIGCKAEPSKVLVLTERGGQHGSFTDVGIEWLTAKGKELNYELTEINNTKPINAEYLSQFDLIVQLDYVTYTWSEEAENAFKDYIENGKGGWIGFHHAGLLGDFDGYKMWGWFSDFMGSIVYQNYIRELSDGTVSVEAPNHPVMKGVNKTFVIPDDEWYIYDRSPREKVKVLASVDEDSYTTQTDIKMGDHPVIWTNEKVKAKNVYFLFGHTYKLFENEDFVKMFNNALHWTLNK